MDKVISTLVLASVAVGFTIVLMLRLCLCPGQVEIVIRLRNTRGN